MFNCWSLVPRNVKWWPVHWYFLSTWRDLCSPQYYFFFCKITLLLRDNAHTIMFTLLKCTIQRSLVYLQILASNLTIYFQNILFSPRRKFIPSRKIEWISCGRCAMDLGCRQTEDGAGSFPFQLGQLECGATTCL